MLQFLHGVNTSQYECFRRVYVQISRSYCSSLYTLYRILEDITVHFIAVIVISPSLVIRPLKIFFEHSDNLESAVTVLPSELWLTAATSHT
jgi:hypothetical protein